MSLERFDRNLEQKYVFVERHKLLLRAWLAHVFAPDPRFFRGTVKSIYFDTPDFDLYLEKRNSDYLKAKLRLRWYEDEAAGDAGREIPCFLEIKRKIGSVRRKDRLKLPIRAACLRDAPFTDPAILELPARACEIGASNILSLVPAAVIRYERRRYVDPASAARISLDTSIRCLRMNPALLCGAPPAHLACGVLEVKGAHEALPEALRPVRHLLHKRSFSKYAACLEHLVHPFGEVA